MHIQLRNPSPAQRRIALAYRGIFYVVASLDELIKLLQGLELYSRRDIRALERNNVVEIGNWWTLHKLPDNQYVLVYDGGLTTEEAQRLRGSRWPQAFIPLNAQSFDAENGASSQPRPRSA